MTQNPTPLQPDRIAAALASLAEADATARALVSTMPRRPSLLRRLVPTTATAFWMATACWLAFLLARAEGWGL